MPGSRPAFVERSSVSVGDVGDGRLRRSAPLLVGLAVVIALGTLALVVRQAGLREGERQRLSDRSRVVERVAENSSTMSDPQRTGAAVAGSSFAPDQPVHNQELLRQLAMASVGDMSLLVALVDPNGTSLVTVPDGLQVPLAGLGTAWTAALAGRPAMSPVFVLRDVPVRAAVVPVGAPRPWAVLVRIVDEGVAREGSEKFAALVSGSGSLCDVDTNGVAAACWKQDLRGQRLVEPGELAGLVPGTVRVWTSGSADGQITNVAERQPTTGYTTIFQQPTARLFADLQTAQRHGNLTLLAVLAVCVGGLVVFGLRREQVARRARARLHTILGGVRDIILVVGDDQEMTFVSSAVHDLLGYDAASWLGRVLTDFADPGDVGRVRRLLADPGGGAVFDVRLITVSGDLRWFDLEASDLTGHPELAGVLVTCHEVGERKDLQDQLGYQASHDLLTGLPNRVVFMDEIERAVCTARAGGTPFAVLFVDLDHFKPVNDGLGHEAGDAVLRLIAERLVQTLRDGDLAVRLGGDEFGILLRGVDEASAGTAADRIIESVRAPIMVGASTVHVDASIGIAASTLEAETPEHLLRAADNAMYEAKRAGKGRFAVATGAPPSTARSGARPGSQPAVPVTEIHDGMPLPEPRRPAEQPAERRFSLPTGPGGSALPCGCTARSRLGRLGPPLVAGGALLAVAAVSLWLQTQARHAAERQRLAEHAALTAIVADSSVRSVDGQRLITAVSGASWSLSDRAQDADTLRSFAGSGIGGRNYVWALASLDGEVLAAEPPLLTLPIGPGDPAWQTARGGRAGNSPVMNVDGVWRDYVTVPVLREGRPVAIVVMGESLRDSPSQANLETSGTLGFIVGGLSVVDSAGTVMFSWNPDLIGQRLAAPADLANLRVGEARQIDLAHAGDRVTIASPVANLLNGGYLVFQQPVPAFYGDIRSGRLIRDGSLLAVVGAALVGLTVLNGRREAAIRRGQGRLQALLHNAHDIVIAIGADGNVTFVSSAAALLLGVAATSYLGRQLPDVAHPDDAATLTEFLQRAADAGTAAVRDVRLPTVGTGHRWFDIEAIDLRDRPEVAGILLTCHEIGERRILQDELRYQASHDALTGLPNRAVFNRRLDALAAQRPIPAFAVLFIDLDRFKSVNDTYGHDAGDEVLRIIGARLREAGTEQDAVCRLGGDEFAVILGDADSARAHGVVDRLLETIRRPVSVGGRSVTVDATIGVALAESQDAPPGAVVRNADLAMYRAKEAGRVRQAACVPTAGQT